MTTKVNLNGISEIDFTNGILSATNTDDVTSITFDFGFITSIDCNSPTGLQGGLDCGKVP